MTATSMFDLRHTCLSASSAPNTFAMLTFRRLDRSPHRSPANKQSIPLEPELGTAVYSSSVEEDENVRFTKTTNLSTASQLVAHITPEVPDVRELHGIARSFIKKVHPVCYS